MTIEPLPETDGGASFDLVKLDAFGKPSCVNHGAMNKVSESPPGFWRCLHLSRCRAGCRETDGHES